VTTTVLAFPGAQPPRQRIDGLDPWVSLATFTRLVCFGGTALDRRDLPRLVLRSFPHRPRTLGWANVGRWEVCLNVWPGITWADTEATLLHELVHLTGIPHHDRAFKVLLATAARYAVGTENTSGLPVDPGDLDARFPGYQELDNRVTSALRRRGPPKHRKPVPFLQALHREWQRLLWVLTD